MGRCSSSAQCAPHAPRSLPGASCRRPRRRFQRRQPPGLSIARLVTAIGWQDGHPARNAGVASTRTWVAVRGRHHPQSHLTVPKATLTGAGSGGQLSSTGVASTMNAVARQAPWRRGHLIAPQVIADPGQMTRSSGALSTRASTASKQRPRCRTLVQRQRPSRTPTIATAGTIWTGPARRSAGAAGTSKSIARCSPRKPLLCSGIAALDTRIG
mmetsp:Transcript_67550/g.218138  ORF Transcript_67550/g.218138 Transcript_67550/m.218138 type:complete len:213 (+) Transcript_67550:1296-1934(+)